MKSAAVFFGPKQVLIYSSVIYLTAFAGYFWYEKSDPQGDENSSCFQQKFPQVPSGSGQVVTIHRTVCAVLGSDSAVYVYIHKLEDQDSHSSLVFRYDDTGILGDPAIHWTSHSSVLISVSDVGEVSKQVPITADGVVVKYEIGKEHYPRRR